MNKLNKIFYGPAGTGKTRNAIKEAVEIINKSKGLDLIEKIKNYDICLEHFKKSSNPLPLDIPFSYIERIQKEKDLEKILKDIPRGVEISLEDMKKYKENYSKYPLIETVTFHPSYSYQDFVEGISVETTSKNQITYTVKDGIFKKICDRAIKNESYNYVLMIDEINRGDISSIFGELFTLLEDTKRKDENEELSINLPYSKDDKNNNPKKLIVPKNLHIVATMNTVDKSIALIDVALRRRFDFEECMPKYGLEELKKYKEINLSKLLLTMNKRITILKNENYQIGHSEFLKIENFTDLKNVMKKSIIPLLQEYFYDDWQSICAVLNQDYTKPTTGILKVTKTDENLFKKEFKEMITYTNQNIFMINEKFEPQDIRDIYSNN